MSPTGRQEANSSPPMRANSISAPSVCGRRAGEFLQHRVAGGMAELIVDLLEMIEVEQQHRQRLMIGLLPRQQARRPSRKARRLATPLNGSISELILCLSSVRSLVMLSCRNAITTVNKQRAEGEQRE